ncbi:MAG: DUF554 domain-containing protein [Lachnospiraceae bacterium]|jgi:uncharacterized membrane protein YqgA involved in biofilm formation|nr:DUF554 domain-containing protein [Lachnospiraceae bacterium]MCI8996697.1 DUF554 domain-containing protein [Lachnospiraceae bacterium]MCI9134520.1 DUF554 domain-containing protein [Lachnospiraceae bacterium]
MSGTVVNVIAVLVGSCIGLLFRKFVTGAQGEPLMKAMGFVTLYIGITGIFDEGAKTMVLIISMVTGTLLGEVLKLDDRLNSFAKKLENRFASPEGGVSIAEGFVTASLLFCVGAMTIVGSLKAGLTGDCTMLYTKSLLDFCSSIIFASTLGVGVIFASVVVLVIQGGITLLAQWAAPIMSNDSIVQMCVVGSLLIMALGTNLIGATKVKVMNMVPAIFMAMILCHFI